MLSGSDMFRFDSRRSTTSAASHDIREKGAHEESKKTTAQRVDGAVSDAQSSGSSKRKRLSPTML